MDEDHTTITSLLRVNAQTFRKSSFKSAPQFSGYQNNLFRIKQPEAASAAVFIQPTEENYI